MVFGATAPPDPAEPRIEQRLAEYRKLLGTLVPPSQLDETLKGFLQFRQTVSPEAFLEALEASILQLKGQVHEQPDRDLAWLQRAYVAAAPKSNVNVAVWPVQSMLSPIGPGSYRRF